MAVSSRKTRMAIVEETTEGTLKAPTSGGDYLALQDGLTLEPSFNTLTSAELKASIASSKAILGLEQPTASLSHYMYGSGTQGVPGEMDLLLKGAFGDTSVASTEYDTVASSTAGTATTAAVIKVDTGEGATFEVGEALLIKDGTNGYSIRPIASISGDDLTLAFNLSVGPPALGINLGKSVLYKPADVGHPSLSIFDFRGNGGAIQAMAGAKVSELGMEVKAGEFVNMSFSLAGTKFFYDPIEITASTSYLDFEDDQGAVSAQIPVKYYRDPHELAQAIEDSMASVTTETPSVTYLDASGKFLIKSTGTLLELQFLTGANTANTIATKIGFTVADSTGTGATTGYTSPSAIVLTSPQSPTLDGQDPFVAKDNEVLLGDFADSSCFCAQDINIKITNTIADVTCICAESGVQEKVVNARESSVEITAVLEAYQAEQFKRFRSNEETSFMFAYGNKAGGNWVAGQSGCVYVPKCTISSFSLSDADGVVVMKMTLSVYTSSGEGEVYLNQL